MDPQTMMMGGMPPPPAMPGQPPAGGQQGMLLAALMGGQQGQTVGDEIPQVMIDFPLQDMGDPATPDDGMMDGGSPAMNLMQMMGMGGPQAAMDPQMMAMLMGGPPQAPQPPMPQQPPPAAPSGAPGQGMPGQPQPQGY